MVKHCCAVGCHNVYKKENGIKFYRFPSDSDRRSKWITAVKRENWQPNEYTWICSQHFVSGEKSNNPLAPNYVPTLFNYVDSPVKRRLESDMDRFHRRQAMKRRRVIPTCSSTSASTAEITEDSCGDSEAAVFDTGLQQHSIDEDMDMLSNPETGNEQVSRNDSIAAETTAGNTESEQYKQKLAETIEEFSKTKELLSKTAHDLLETKKQLTETEGRLSEINDQFTEMEQQLSESKKQLTETKEELTAVKKRHDKLHSENSKLSTRVITESLLTDDDKMVKYYTGLPSYELLKTIFEFVIVGLPSGFFTSSCNVFEQFLIALTKLRLNLGDQDLAYRFGIHQSTVSRYFNKWLDVLYEKLSLFVSWPERDQLMKTMPTEFRKNFRKCVIIIDCFEVFTERPTSLMARAQTWSNYKKHNTVKFLIGITPQGSVAFISKGWGGRVSDIHLTENCGLLKHLLPGDVVLADRGFNIQEAAGMYCAEVKIPPYTKGKKQLSKLEIDVSRRLSRIRIHVERVIGMVRQKYTILQSTLPINMIMCEGDAEVSTIDKIVLVACALCNHCDSVIPFD